MMSNRVILIAVLAVLPLLTQATPVDVNGDGVVGPQEIIDLSQRWKGPAGSQPWEVNGTSIFYNGGSVGIGTNTPDTTFQVNDGRIRIRETATPERWDLFYDPPTETFYLQENAAYNHIVFSKGPESRVGIGTDTPNVNSKLDVVNSGYEAIRAEGQLYGVAAIASGGSGTGLYATGSLLAAQLNGDVTVYGVFTDAKSTFQIDHPLDPENKVLSHSSVESPDMMNIYNGNVITDAIGYAEVTLPDYFEALNKDFRYQLTVIGQFAQAIIEKKIEDNRFTIRTDKPNVEVSWLVTGVRQDAYAKAHPNVVELDKSPGERGKYLSPGVYGQPKQMGIGYRP